MKRQKAAQSQKDLIIENQKEFQKHINSLFATDSGMLFAKYWLKDMGLFGYDDSKDGMGLVENKGAKRFYLKYVRPNLSESVKHKIEGQL